MQQQDQYEASTSMYTSQQTEPYDAVATQHTPSIPQTVQPHASERPPESTVTQNESEAAPAPNGSTASEGVARERSESPEESRGRKRTRTVVIFYRWTSRE